MTQVSYGPGPLGLLLSFLSMFWFHPRNIYQFDPHWFQSQCGHSIKNIHISSSVIISSKCLKSQCLYLANTCQDISMHTLFCSSVRIWGPIEHILFSTLIYSLRFQMLLMIDPIERWNVIYCVSYISFNDLFHCVSFILGNGS